MKFIYSPWTILFIIYYLDRALNKIFSYNLWIYKYYHIVVLCCVHFCFNDSIQIQFYVYLTIQYNSTLWIWICNIFSFLYSVISMWNMKFHSATIEANYRLLDDRIVNVRKIKWKCVPNAIRLRLVCFGIFCGSQHKNIACGTPKKIL